jgi:hypothetical protein
MDLLRQGLNVAKRELDAYVPGATTKIKQLADKAKAIAMSASELEMKVLEATNHEPWGPHGKDMQGECVRGVRGGPSSSPSPAPSSRASPPCRRLRESAAL